MSKKYIIFDFDGTLVHTNDVIIGSWQATYEHYLGRKVSRSQIEQTFGETLADTIRNRIPKSLHPSSSAASTRLWGICRKNVRIRIML